MKRRMLLATAATGAAVITAGVLVSASLATASTGRVTMHVHEVSKSATYVPIGSLVGSKAQSNQGDLIAFYDPLSAPTGGAAIGRITGGCQQVNARQGIFMCTVEFAFPRKGTIIATGPFDASGKSTTVAAITGGTGQFDSAHGVVKVKALDQRTNDFVLNFVP